MILEYIKSDVYRFHMHNNEEQFLNENELLRLIKNNDIADVIKTPIGYLVIHDIGVLPFKHYLKIISNDALDLLYCVIKNISLDQYYKTI